jgi:hypothetical protein
VASEKSHDRFIVEPVMSRNKWIAAPAHFDLVQTPTRPARTLRASPLTPPPSQRSLHTVSKSPHEHGEGRERTTT